MKHLNQKADKIFRSILSLANGERYLKLDNGGEGIMPAVFEKLHSVNNKYFVGDVWSIAHYHEVNGDLCNDPEMTFLVTTGAIYPLSFEMQGSVLARYEVSVSMEGENIGYKKRMQSDHTSFANQWLVNIKHQQLGNLPPAAKPAAPVDPLPDGSKDVELVDYSEKAVAVFGNTKPIKDDLKNIGGRFNPHLTKDGSKVPGWIFSKNKLADLKTLLSL